MSRKEVWDVMTFSLQQERRRRRWWWNEAMEK
jgi:hypothetical protein